MSARLEIDSLRTLKAIADHGGVTNASRHLALSQSAVSHKIRRLEENIDSALLSRRAGAPLLTEQGERLLRYADRIVNLHDEALQALGKSDLTGSIRLGMTEDTSSSGLARILGRFSQLHPGIGVRTHVAQSLVLDRELAAGRIDLAVMQTFVTELHAGDIVLFRERLHWVKAPDWSLANRETIPFLSFDEDCFYRHWAMANGAARSWKLETVLDCASAAGIGAAIEAGMGVALLNQRQISPAMEIVDRHFETAPDIAHIVRTAKARKSSAVAALVMEIEQKAEGLLPKSSA